MNHYLIVYINVGFPKRTLVNLCYVYSNSLHDKISCTLCRYVRKNTSSARFSAIWRMVSHTYFIFHQMADWLFI